MYYPKSKIQEGLYTSGNEFIISSTKEKYAGYYYATYDGKYYTGQSPTDSSLLLIKPQDSIKDISTRGPEFYYPVITEADYNNGYITRYFSKRVNGDATNILEITEKDYDRYTDTLEVLYITTQLDWKISGPLYDDFSNPNMPVYGVVDTNKRMIKLKEKEIPCLGLYLHNLTQFYEGQI